MQFIFRFVRLSSHGPAIFSSRVCFGFVVLGLMLVSQQTVRSASSIADGASVEKFTGGHTRAVWVTDAKNKDSFAERNHLQLVGYDSRDGKGERIICSERANYYRPLITPDGEQIVFSNRQNLTIYAVKWDGSSPKLLKQPGCASEVWRDPRTGKTWVYYQESLTGFHEACPPLSHRRARESRDGLVFIDYPSLAIISALAGWQNGCFDLSVAKLRSGGITQRCLAQAPRWLLALDGSRRQLPFVDF